jgi:hypothetical protein
MVPVKSNFFLNYYTMRCAEFRDDYRVDTVKTYKEWLRRKGFLTEICKCYCIILVSDILSVVPVAVPFYLLCILPIYWQEICCLYCATFN